MVLASYIHLSQHPLCYLFPHGLRSTAIQIYDLAIDPLSFFARKESNNISDILREAIAMKRRCKSCHLLSLLGCVLLAIRDVVVGDIMKHICHGASWCDAIDSDLLITAILGEDANEGVDGAFRSRIERVSRNTEVLGSIRRGHNDPASLGQVSICFSSNKKLTPSIQAKDSIEFLFRDILEMTEADNPGVAYSNIDMAEMGDCLVE